MILGLLTVEILIPASTSLKDKRVILRSIKERLRKKFNVSVAEVDFQDKWKRSRLAVATVSAKRKYVEETLSKIFQNLDGDFKFEIIHYEFEYSSDG